MHFQEVLYRLLKPISRVGIALDARRYRKFERDLRHARTIQRDWILNRVAACRDTRFGREHGFHEIRMIEDFRKRVPVATYEHFAPYIDAVARRETDALFPPGEKLLQFTITTGSSGTPKLNPVTDRWLREYRRAWDVWGLKLLSDHREYVGGKILQMAGTWDMGRTAGGLQISMVSALLARQQNPMVRPFYAIPNAVSDIPDPVSRYYTVLRMSITEPISLIILMNPGTLLMMARLGDEFRDQLIRDVRHGTLNEDLDIPGTVRDELRRRLPRASPAQADRLQRFVDDSGHLYPRDYWPQRPIVAGWIGGTAGYQARSIPEFFGDVPLRDMGLVSSEGRHTIPLEPNVPEGVPAIHFGYYEFIPTGQIDSPQPQTLEGHELEVGQEYFMLMSTYGGYYRFNIGDIVRCNGFRGEAPVLEFLQKGDRSGDLEGEKVTELQFLTKLADAADELGLSVGYATAVPFRPENGLPCYIVLLEHGDCPDAATARELVNRLDRGLQEINFLYNARRRESCLGPPRLWRLPPRAWKDYVQDKIARHGGGDIQYKHPGIVTDTTLLDRFRPVDVIAGNGD